MSIPLLLRLDTKSSSRDLPRLLEHGPSQDARSTSPFSSVASTTSSQFTSSPYRYTLQRLRHCLHSALRHATVSHVNRQCGQRILFIPFPPGNVVRTCGSRYPKTRRQSDGTVARSICSLHFAESAIPLHIDAMPCMHLSGVILLGYCIHHLSQRSFIPRPLAPVASNASIACITAIHAHRSSPGV
jgi:hypothetical protein